MLHIVEPGGRGGVYQHTLALAADRASGGGAVTIHTARDNELELSARLVTTCTCMRWERRGPAAWRQLVSLLWVGLRLLPHLARVADAEDEWEVQGVFGRGAYLACLLVLRCRGVAPAFAPHNDFARAGNRFERRALKWAERLASTVVVYGRDSARVRSDRGVAVVQRALTQYVPAGWQSWLSFWEDRWRGRPVVLFAGQLRMDKNPQDLIAVSARLGARHLLAFVGEDKGALAAIQEDADQRGLEIDVVDGYLELPRFAAAIASSTVVVCPYALASQSGVLALARALGTPTVAADTGNLREQADETFAPGDLEGLRQAVERLLPRHD